MSRIMIVVEFEVKPEHRSAFVELMKGHAQRSRAEDGKGWHYPALLSGTSVTTTSMSAIGSGIFCRN